MAVDTIEKALFSILAGDVTVGAIAGDKIYPLDIAQQDSKVGVTYQQISGRREHTMTDTIGMVEARYQFNCWASTYASCRSLSNAVRGALDNYAGTTGTVKIFVIHLINEGDGIDKAGTAKESRRYLKWLDFTIWFQE